MSSSPFEIFRRNLKPLMVLLTLLALFSFVVLPALDTYLRRGGGINADPVAASFDGVELTRGHVARTTQNHASVVRFLSELASRTMEKGGMPQTPGFQYDEQNQQIRSLGIDTNPSEEATINTLRFYSEAKKAGFELDDTAVSNWLARYVDGTMNNGEIVALLMKSTGNQLGQQHLYEQLRMHLLADLYQRGALVGLTNGQIPVVTPLGQWENFLKTNQQASVDAYGVLVSEYFDKTNESPSQSEINEVYEEGKNRINYPNDLSPAPRFRRPDSAKIEFVSADLNKFMEIEKAKITEEQLRAEYERRLAGGDFQLPVEPELGEEELAEASKQLEAAIKAASAQDKAEMEAEAAEAEAETDAGTEAAEETATEPEAEPADEDSSMNLGDASAVRLVMFQNEEAPATETPSTETVKEAVEEVATEATEAVEEAAKEATAEETPAEAEAAQEEMAAEQTEEEETSTEEAATEEPAAEEAPADTAAPEMAATESAEADASDEASDDSLDLDDEPAPTKPQTFEEVREQIANEMASQPARRALDLAVTEANKRMRRYFSERAVHESNVSVGVQTEEDAPERLDLKAMAEELGLGYGKTDELINRVTATEITPGNSFGLGANFNRRGPPFNAILFGAQMQDGSLIPPQALYSPMRTVDLEAAVTYITWKTEDVESYLPELDEVRDEVIQVIRTREARTLAKAAADELAKAASVEGQTLADVVPESQKDNLITGVGPFSWLDQVGFMETVVTNVPELDAVGEDFMRAVFSSQVGEHAVASNDPQSVFYVVTPTEFQPDAETLHEQFRQPQQRFMAQLLGNGDARNIVRGFYESVDERTGFEMNIADDE
ncbi:hypothetical protein SAMN06265222_10819 [Neorhodopirellula lusitana]|uniref:Uncharacterized protein n=1 Tax=Neorhodopirellula lusitana TaxID=445327 RepID=A0ABY1QCU0_9BACT|nr:hypothetical protein [Neorhodopirellula lusitana]SMP63109.1 hypothetical protein SAMN06265222_10819 [Neorhodopirellula lusitana]